jgi:hypothetical protein
MTFIELLQYSRRAGITLEAREGVLRIEAPQGILRDSLRAAFQDHKPRLLELLTCDPTSMVERVGRQMQYFEEHRHEWSDAEWTRRRRELCERMDLVHEVLLLRGETWEQYGWAVTGYGVWQRTTRVEDDHFNAPWTNRDGDVDPDRDHVSIEGAR